MLRRKAVLLLLLLLLLLLQKYWFKWHISRYVLLGHFTKLRRYNVPIDNVQLVNCPRFSKQRSRRLRGVRLNFLVSTSTFVPSAIRLLQEPPKDTHSSFFQSIRHDFRLTFLTSETQWQLASIHRDGRNTVITSDAAPADWPSRYGASLHLSCPLIAPIGL